MRFLTDMGESLLHKDERMDDKTCGLARGRPERLAKQTGREYDPYTVAIIQRAGALMSKICATLANAMTTMKRPESIAPFVICVATMLGLPGRQ
jgi:hypothetical protein